MSQIVEVQPIDKLLITGKNSFLNVTTTTISLWDSNTAQSLKTVMFPPLLTIKQSVLFKEDQEFALYITTSKNTLIQFTKTTFDYSRAKVFQNNENIQSIYPISLTQCLVALNGKIGIVEFGKQITFNEQFKIDEIVQSIVLYKNCYIIATEKYLYSYTQDGKQLVKKQLQNDTFVKCVCDERLYIFGTNKTYLMNEKLNVQYEFDKQYNDVSEMEEYVLFSGNDQSDLYWIQYKSCIKTYRASEKCGINNKVILYSNKNLEIVDIPPKPKLSDCLKSISSSIVSKECNANDFIGSYTGNYTHYSMKMIEEEDENEEEYEQYLPSFDELEEEQFVATIKDCIKNYTNLRWNLWDQIHARIQMKQCSIETYWNIIFELTERNLIRDYTEILDILIQEEKMEHIEYIIQKQYITVNEQSLLQLIKIAIEKHQDNTSFITHLFD